MSKFIENQNWRYATKKFDATKKVSETDLETLKEAIRLSTSSYGLQLYKVILVENPEVRAKLQPASWGQTQIVDASHLIVLANQTNVGNPEIDSYIENISKTRNLPVDALSGYSDFMKGAINPLSEEYCVLVSTHTLISLHGMVEACIFHSKR